MIRGRHDISNNNNNYYYYKEFARLYNQVYDEYMLWIKPHLESKDLRFMRVIPVEKAIESTIGILPLITDRYSDIVERNNSFCLVNVCACRYEHELLGKGCGKPLDVCSAMGWIADLAIQKGLARRVSRKEFVEAKMRASEAGLVNMTDNLRDPLQVCSCCACCCSGLKMIKEYNIPTVIAKSHFEVVVNIDKCIGCGKCAKICPMAAIQVNDKKAVVDYNRCIGCGVCIIKCEHGKALNLRERAYHKPPSANVLDYFTQRYVECLGREKEVIPRVSLGVSSLLTQLGSQISPFHVSGPKYRPPK
jgi:Pyruvate/2-oxoacid:ferredoxin oxidoreductase delta subunit